MLHRRFTGLFALSICFPFTRAPVHTGTWSTRLNLTAFSAQGGSCRNPRHTATLMSYKDFFSITTEIPKLRPGGNTSKHDRRTNA